VEKEYIILPVRCSFSTYVLLKDNMFLLHLGAPEGSDVPSPLRCNEEHISGEGTSYPSGAPKWRRNILSFRST
jgi:hypothetical protein